jgi:UDPglucose 6-dehydrogenase
MRVCYIGGCGRLGLALAAWSAHKGHDVVCADINRVMVDAVNRGDVGKKTIEPLVADLVRKHHGNRLIATGDTISAVKDCELILIIVPTPSNPDGSFDMQYVRRVCKEIGVALKSSEYTTIVVGSTVNPGDTGGLILDQLEQSSGKRAGPDFGLVYSPEFIRQGSIAYDFANPDQILIGQLDERSGQAATAYYASIVENNPPIYHMSLVSAEIAKIGLNATVVTKLGVAGTLMWLCHNTPEADARDVLRAIGSDPRIGPSYFKPGLWPGGPCFPRDCRALQVACEHKNVDSTLAMAADQTSSAQARQLVSLVISLMNSSQEKVGVLGLSYKPGVDITEESQGALIARNLQRWHKVNVMVYDPIVKGVTGVTHASSLKDCVISTDILVLATMWPEFAALKDLDLTGKTVLDCWGFFDPDELDCKRYIRLGKGAE